MTLFKPDLSILLFMTTGVIKWLIRIMAGSPHLKLQDLAFSHLKLKYA